MGTKKSFYDAPILEYQKKYFATLPEKQRRYFLAFEYLKFGRGSQRYLAKAYGAARQVIVDGVKEITTQGFQPNYHQQRRPGGGRKKKSNLS